MQRLRAAVPVLAAVAACLLAVAPAASAHSSSHDRGDDGPLITGHRGAPGYLPDHTLEGYKLATRWAPTTSSLTWSRRRTAT
jgi:hypothetical protein